ncbi:hypothetical protein B1H26_09145 [Amycolatopsis sp. BJA-103]|nr:hypothetical protein B1H26_09145 [Amycolatopsis sp. BJA-103]
MLADQGLEEFIVGVGCKRWPRSRPPSSRPLVLVLGDLEGALRMVTRTIIGSCVHRAASSRIWADGLSWSIWASETTGMALAYLTSVKDSGRG